MSNIGIGVIEGFFGPPWSWEDRASFIEFLSKHGGEYYIYAPKRDSYLRKNWTQNHPKEEWAQLQSLSAKCKDHGIKFGLGLSPFEIHNNWNFQSREKLKNKIAKLEELDFHYLGLFFDDMPGGPNLSKFQSDIVKSVSQSTSRTILFCPTYYSEDPILDKVFGTRPANYLEEIGQNIPANVQFLWTGPKVISNTVEANHLDSVGETLCRKPIVWENFFANDGPKNCKFLKLKPFKGRDQSSYKSSSGWAFNLMNQASLSKIVFLSATKVLQQSKDPDVALHESLTELTSKEFADFVINHQEELLSIGLDQLDQNFTKTLHSTSHPHGTYGQEIINWLEGKYTVGTECLTD